MIRRADERNQNGDRNVPCLVYGRNYLGIYIYQNSWNYTLKMNTLLLNECILYINDLTFKMQ